MHRARRLMRFAEYDEAAAELDGEPPATRRPRARWLHLRGMALYQTRKHYAEAARLLRRAARIGGPHAIDDEFHAARALSRADRDDQAIDDYRELLGDHPRHPRAAQAEFLAAWLELHHGQRSGEWHMERFVEGPRGRRSPSRRRQGVWHLGLRAYERQRFSRAAEMFERYAHMGSGPMVQARGAYWLGRTRQSAGDRDAAAESYRRAMQVQPLHWYALLARQRLVELGEDPGPPFGGEPETKASPPEPLEPTLPPGPALYARLGFRGDAVRALRRQERPVRAAAPQGRELEALVTAYQRLGVAERPYRLVVVRHRGVLGERPSPTNRWIWQAAYPRPWPEAARAAAASRGLRPELLYAIMRQESSYDPDVVSYAGAVGLMQVMPATAQKLADRHGIEVRRDMLFLPDWNLRFGATYVDQLLQQLEGQVPLAVAAFNAGAANVRSWLDERGELPLDHFVERIPFDQTRNYVRHVISHYARYRYLDDPDAGWPFELTMKLPVSSP
jgi:soluble lytic murein transglycosylase